jgi:hypothetical protein
LVIAAIVSYRVGTDLAGTQVRVDADDVGLPTGEAEQPRSAAADEDPRTGLLRGLRDPFVVLDRVMPPFEGERTVAPRALQDRERLTETLDARAVRVVRETEGFVVGRHPSCSDACFDAAVRQHVDRRELLGHDRRVLVVVPEHEGADA